MKRSYFIALFFFGLLSSCTSPIEQPNEGAKEKTDVPVSSVSLSRSSVELVEGEAITLTATVSPNNATDKTVSWLSSKSSIASVDQNGTVKALSVGSTTITASIGGKSASCNVTVLTKTISVESIVLNKSELTLYEEETFSLVATVSPANATEPTITWSSSNSIVAIIDNKGLITAKKEGTSIITASNGSIKATCSVTVLSGVLSIHNSKKGGLQQELSKYDFSKVRVLTISGVLNDIDFLYIKENTSHLNKLDISEVEIDEIPILFNSYHRDKPIDIVFPKQLKRFKDNQFSYSGVHSIWIGNNVSEIADLAFGYCSSLESVVFESGNDTNLLQIKGGKITDIYRYHGAFYSCTALTEITFPIRIFCIYAGAFDSCSSLRKVVFDKNAQLEFLEGYLSNSANSYYYSNGAFHGCSLLEEVILPDNIRVIGDLAFGETALKRIDLTAAKNLTTIGAGAFRNTKITEIVIPNTVTTIGKEAFSYTDLSSVVFSKNASLEIIQYRSFSNNYNLKQMVIPASVKTITQAAFQGDNMDILSFEPNSQLESIVSAGYGWLGLFNGGSLGSGSVRELDFSNCSHIKQFCDYALYFSGTTIVRIGTLTPPTIYDDTLTGCHFTILKVPKGAIDSYKKSPWASYTESISALDE